MIWKIYFWVMTVLIPIGFIGMGSNVHWKVHLVDWLNLVFMVIGMVGVFGYSYKRELGTRRFWTLFLPVALLYQLSYSFLLDQRYGSYPATSMADGLITFVPLIPMFMALLLYVNRSRLTG